MLREFLWAWGPWIYNTSIEFIIRSKHLARVVYNEITLEKEWVFLRNLPVPLSSESFGNIPSVGVKWRCKLTPPRFSEPNSILEERHVSYLGFIVKIPGHSDIDLSEWINEIQYIGSSEPTTSEIFALWCCENNISYFHLLDVITVDCITDMGDCLTKGLNE
jgi:hypothetical protein